MVNFLLAFGTFLFLFVLLFLSVGLGYRLGVWRKVTLHEDKASIIKVAEGTVFALLGLLIAFSFSGAYERFEERKIKIIAEFNAIETVYRRIDLLAPDKQANMRQLLKGYIDQRLAAYSSLSEFNHFKDELEKAKDEQNLVWDTAMAAVNDTNSHATTLLFIPAVNNMFEIADTRIMITRMHPAIGIFFLLIGLASLSGFLIGYGMSKKESYSSVYVFCYVAITAFTLYIIIDLEFPRIGLIRVDSFNYLLVEARNGIR